jgi:hypothetical protein
MDTNALHTFNACPGCSDPQAARQVLDARLDYYLRRAIMKSSDPQGTVEKQASFREAMESLLVRSEVVYCPALNNRAASPDTCPVVTPITD